MSIDLFSGSCILCQPVNGSTFADARRSNIQYTINIIDNIRIIFMFMILANNNNFLYEYVNRIQTENLF